MMMINHTLVTPLLYAQIAELKKHIIFVIKTVSVILDPASDCRFPAQFSQ